MEKIKQKLFTYWDTKNEYDKRTILRDCSDIFIFGRHEVRPYYNDEDFHIVKLLRIARNKDTKEEFLKFIEYITNHQERGIDYIVKLYVTGAIRRLNDLNNEIYNFKENSILQERIL